MYDLYTHLIEYPFQLITCNTNLYTCRCSGPDKNRVNFKHKSEAQMSADGFVLKNKWDSVITGFKEIILRIYLLDVCKRVITYPIF